MSKSPPTRPHRHPRGLAGTSVLALALLILLQVPIAPASSWAAGLESAAASILAAQPEEVRQRVLRGEITQVDAKQGVDFQALLTFQKPIDRVSKLLSQTQRQMEFRRDLKHSATLAVFHDGALERQRMRFGFFDFVVHLRYVVDAAGRSIRWQLDDRYDNDMRRLSGYWELHPLGASQTLARFGSKIDVGLPTPARVKRRATLTDIERVRRWVDSEGTWRP